MPSIIKGKRLEQGDIGEFRKYKCRHCERIFSAYTANPIPEKERLCPSCQDELGITTRRLRESLESMGRELENRIRAYGEGHWMVQAQRESIARAEARLASER